MQQGRTPEMFLLLSGLTLCMDMAWLHFVEDGCACMMMRDN